MMIIGSDLVPFDRVKLINFDQFIRSSEESKSHICGFVKVDNLKDAVFANALEAKFIVCDDIALAKKLQSLANDYLFDSKISILIDDDKDLEKAIEARIDAVIYRSAVDILTKTS